TGVDAGSSTISASLGGILGSPRLTATAAPYTTLFRSPPNPTIAKGTTQQFTATGHFTDGTTPDLTSSVTWASGSLGAATIDATGKATGDVSTSATFSAPMGGILGSTTLTVSAAVLQSI